MNVLTLYSRLLVFVVLPLIAGMAFSRTSHARRVASGLFVIALYFFQTFIPFVAVWKADLANRSWALPMVTMTGWVLSVGVAYLVRNLFDHGPKQAGSFIFTMGISNHGFTLLGIIALIVFGDAGLAQATYGQLLFMPFLVLVCFPIARSYSEAEKRRGFVAFLKRNLLDKRNLPLVAMIGGLILNVSDIERPDIFARVLPTTVYVGTIMSGIAVGLLFHPASTFRYLRENIFSLVYRSTLYPLFFLGAATALGLGRIDTCVLVLYGIVPAGIFSNLIADMFDLDRGLANSVYIVSTTIFLITVLPFYLYVVSVV